MSVLRNDANYCRRMGWGPGTLLRVERDVFQRHRPRHYRVTAVGEAAILVREVFAAGHERTEDRWVRRLVNSLAQQVEKVEGPL